MYALGMCWEHFVDCVLIVCYTFLVSFLNSVGNFVIICL